MRPSPEPTLELECHAATPDRWPDVERLFGPRGACAGCWCMYWRRTAAEFERGKGEGNRAELERVVSSGEEPGVIAYAGGEPAGWCAVAPRAVYPRLERSRILRPVDDLEVWSIVCLYVARPWRRRGVSEELLRAAVTHAASRGARIVEGYPVEPASGRMPDAFAWTGVARAFLRAGFEEVARRSDARPIMRWTAPET